MNTLFHLLELADASPGCSQDPGGMRLVHHQDGIMFSRQRSQVRQGSQVAIHTEQCIGNDQPTTKRG